MREIRFRAWDTLKKEMIVEDFFIGSNGRLYYYNSDDRLCSTKSMIPMQFTGFEDKNRKDVFEGDVVKFFMDNLYVVKFGDYMAGGLDYYASEAYGYYFEPLHGSDYEKTDTSTLGPGCEIIGNIYENPELTTSNLKDIHQTKPIDQTSGGRTLGRVHTLGDKTGDLDSQILKTTEDKDGN